MLKNRLIPVLFLKNGFLVRSELFSNHQKLGNPYAQVTRYNDWDVDELIYLDITREGNYENRSDLGDVKNLKTYEEIIKEVSSKCFMPLTFGGGIKTIDDARSRFELGSDKITINSQAIKDPSFINQLAEEFGSQAIILSIDSKLTEDKINKVFTEWGSKETNLKTVDWARECQERGAGEILINSIDRDGTAEGYDINLIKSITEVTSIPIIACGGVGRYKDFITGIVEGKASAVAAGNFFNFKELAYPIAKNELKKNGLNFR